MKLYELTDAYAGLAALLDECDSEEEAAQLWAQMDEIGASIAEKADNYARYLRNKQAEADGLGKEIERLQNRKRSAENQIEQLRERMKFAMGVAGATEIRTTLGKWTVRKNAPRVEVLDESKVAPEFFEPQPPKLMKSRLQQHWKDTGEIPDGCDVVQRESVQFR